MNGAKKEARPANASQATTNEKHSTLAKNILVSAYCYGLLPKKPVAMFFKLFHLEAI